MLCPICGEEDDSQEHIFSCKPIRKIYLASHKYEDIYFSNANTLLGVAKDLKNLADARRTLLSPDGDKSIEHRMHPHPLPLSPKLVTHWHTVTHSPPL